VSRRPSNRAARRGWGTAGAATFTPVALSGCVLWLRSDLGITLNGADVSAWADQSGTAVSLAQATASKQPLYNATDADFGGAPSVAFTSADSHTLESSATITYGPHTIFLVAGPLAASGSYYFTRKSGGTYREYCYGNDPMEYVGDRNGTGASSINNSDLSAWSTVAGVKTIEMQMDGTHAGHTVRVNGVDKREAGGATNDPGTGTGAGTLWLASEDGTGGFGQFEMSEMLIYSRVLTAGEITQVEAYLRARYGHY
jgi:hypothetical protein